MSLGEGPPAATWEAWPELGQHPLADLQMCAGARS
jgi:hypothetical protein